MSHTIITGIVVGERAHKPELMPTNPGPLQVYSKSPNRAEIHLSTRPVPFQDSAAGAAMYTCGHALRGLSLLRMPYYICETHEIFRLQMRSSQWPGGDCRAHAPRALRLAGHLAACRVAARIAAPLTASPISSSTCCSRAPAPYRRSDCARNGLGGRHARCFHRKRDGQLQCQGAGRTPAHRF